MEWYFLKESNFPDLSSQNLRNSNKKKKEKEKQSSCHPQGLQQYRLKRFLKNQAQDLWFPSKTRH